ncbi:hypothetical protein LCGC14_0633480 [marine sediment metagenome]|uniref:VWFA domain-containing protein n=1 Tax=marine sediment metagenome TaxID=412755 RepID=A0A0F9RKM0_9ZZZZ
MSDWLKIVTSILLMGCLMPIQSIHAETSDTNDLRVVIDVSGSMKKNDPKNLRAPALRMLVGLMPDDATAGVWTFAKMVNMLVPQQSVDDDWRQKAIEKSSKIHSLGLFTDIEQALKRATAKGLNAQNKRQSVILLSDGFIDLQAGEKASNESRNRILKNLVPKLKAANMAVHTIALSDNADHALLKELSLETDGWYEQASNTDDLQRIFLHMFEKATQPDTVPLAKDNQFKIDNSVNEMTVLVFRQANTEATKLQLPDGSSLSQSDASDTVRWMHENSFDLITIDKPATGTWQINAAVDPDNRVMVVTDMKLETSDLPNNVLKGETFDFSATLTDHGETITRDKFLELVDGSLKQTSRWGDHELTLTLDPEKSQFNATLGEKFSSGREDVIVTLKTPTFERQRRQSINVVAAPFYVETERLEGESRSHQIQLQVEPTLINPASLSIKALLRDENGSEWPYEMQKTDTNKWQLTVTELKAEQNYSLSLQLSGETPEGRPIFIQSDPVELTDEPSLASLDDLEPIPDAILPEDEPLTDDLPMDDDILMNDGLSAEESEPMSDTMKLLIGNGFIVILLIAGIIWWRRQSSAAAMAGDML